MLKSLLVLIILFCLNSLIVRNLFATSAHSGRPSVRTHEFVNLKPLSRAPASQDVKQTIFEGYYKILNGGVHSGFVIERQQYDPKTKKFLAAYLIKTGELAGGFIESVQAEANNKFEPIGYKYAMQSKNGAQTIEASFEGNKMNAVISDGKQAKQITKTFKKGSFLSIYLRYLMLQQGYKENQKFVYSGIAEEEGEAYSGEAMIKELTTQEGQQVYKVLNRYKNTQFVSYVTPKGEVIATRSPVQGIETQLVATPAEATKGFGISPETLKKVFGSVPVGNENVLSKAKGKK